MTCDRCRRRATHVHITPSVCVVRAVEIACVTCDPGGYWFPLTEWHGARGMREHILSTKHGGRATVDAVELRLAGHRPTSESGAV